jgi:hypothetical protein
MEETRRERENVSLVLNPAPSPFPFSHPRDTCAHDSIPPNIIKEKRHENMHVHDHICLSMHLNIMGILP